MGSVLTTLRGLGLATPWTLQLVLSDLLISGLLPFKYFFPNAVYDASSFLAFLTWKSIQTIFEKINGAKITVSGDTLPQQESAIVIANHISWTDFYIVQALALRARMLSRCRWFAKIQLRWVPLLGWGLWAMGMPMVSRNWMRDQRELDRVFAGITERKWPTWLVSFSEATRYTPKKYEETKRWCSLNSKPCPQHLLYPRTKGFITTVQHLRTTPHVRAVYDMTIAYSHQNNFMEPPTIWETLSCGGLSEKRGYRFHVDVKRFPLDELPETDEGLAKWLEKRWLEKGQFLESKRAEWTRD